MIEEGFERFEKALAEASDPLDELRRFASYRGIETEISKKFLIDLKEKYPHIMEKLVVASDEVLPLFQQLILDAQQKGQIRQDISPLVISSFIRYVKRIHYQS